MSAAAAWHIITGEYPPDSGGVSDYTELVARALAAAGDEVHVWAPGSRVALREDCGVIVHRVRGYFGVRAMADLARGLDASPGPRRILVEYVPNAFGLKGANVPFCAWLATRREKLWVMFHEVATPWHAGKIVRDFPLAVVTRFDAALVAKRATAIFVSVPAWEKLLMSFVPRCPRATWSPIPSNFPVAANDALLDEVIAKKRADESPQWIGHFGTYGGLVRTMLACAIERVLRNKKNRRVILLGRGAEKFAAALPAEMVDRVTAPRVSTPDEIVAHLSACDVIVQPYADGISSRRTSVMASVALGRAVISHEGAQTEPIWKSSRAVLLARDESAEAYAHAVDALLAEPALAAAIGERARTLYAEQFSIERTIATLREAAHAEERA